MHEVDVLETNPTVHLGQLHRLPRVWNLLGLSQVGKDALNRFYAICNCCKCGGIDAMVNYGIPMVTSSGYVAQPDTDLCVACGTCEDACPFRAVHVNGTSTVE